MTTYEVKPLIRNLVPILGVLRSGINVLIEEKSEAPYSSVFFVSINGKPAFEYGWYVDDKGALVAWIQNPKIASDINLFEYNLTKGPMLLEKDMLVSLYWVFNPVVVQVDSPLSVVVITDPLISEIVEGREVNRTLLRAAVANPLVSFAFREYDSTDSDLSNLPLVSRLIYDKLSAGFFKHPSACEAANELAWQGVSLRTIASVLTQEEYPRGEIRGSISNLIRQKPSMLFPRLPGRKKKP